MNIDPWILAFSAITVIATVWMGFWSAKRSKTASDFFVAGRSVSVGWNASAISGEYLSAASFMGVAGMVMSSGYDALWYPVCYACGYLFLLLFIAGPLRRFGAYTIPDFAEGRFDSPVFRKIAVVFVLFIGFFYTMPQMKGAGVTLAYIFPGLPYWVGVVLVGAVITLNVALGGMKGITLVQAFQYWIKMFAISVPIFVLMAVYGNYGKQIEKNDSGSGLALVPGAEYRTVHTPQTNQMPVAFWKQRLLSILPKSYSRKMSQTEANRWGLGETTGTMLSSPIIQLHGLLSIYGSATSKTILIAGVSSQEGVERRLAYTTNHVFGSEMLGIIVEVLRTNGVVLVSEDTREVRFAATNVLMLKPGFRSALPDKAPPDSTWLSLAETRVTNRIAVSTSMSLSVVNGWVTLKSPRIVSRAEERLNAFFGQGQHYSVGNAKLVSVLLDYTQLSGRTVIVHTNVGLIRMLGPLELNWNDWGKTVVHIEQFLATNGVALRTEFPNTVRAMTREQATLWDQQAQVTTRRALPEKAPADSTWLSPFGPLTTKAAKAAAAVVTNDPAISGVIPLAPAFASTNRVAVNFTAADITQVLPIYSDLTARALLPRTNGVLEKVDALLNGQLTRWQLVEPGRVPFAKLTYHPTNYVTVGELKRAIEDGLKAAGVTLVPVGERYFRAIETSKLNDYWKATIEDRQRAWLAKHERPLALLYTYSLIIALVCGTAGLPHILVRFYTNPDGVAAKRTTMWVMILIGVFYLFPPVFGVMGRNLMPSLYEGTGAKGTDKVVLELPRILNEKKPTVSRDGGEGSEGRADSLVSSPPSPTSRDTPSSARKRGIPWGSILSGITCAGAFAAFMSTFSGLLVSMTGALAHDVYGRILRPKSTPEQRLRMFKLAAVLIGGVAIVLGSFVEPLEINFMVGQAFAIAAASYFPLLFMSVWWRGMTTRGAATGMLVGGLCALIGATLTNVSNLALDKGPMGTLFAGFAPLNDFWATHPLLRILCEQPAIWAVPLAIALMIIVSRLTSKDVPKHIRSKMLVLHAPEKLGLKQEYIQEHHHGH